MKTSIFIITCSLCVSSASMSHAAVVGSSRPEAQANFQKLIKTNECPACDLAGVVLTRIDLSDANLENANLAGAQLFLTDLSDANLRNANLQGAKLGGADLGGADLRGANLTGAILEGAYLKGAMLDGQVVSAAPYADDELQGVTETQYIANESRGKKAPYTQDVILNDSRVPEKSAQVLTAPIEFEQKTRTSAKGLQEAQTKKMAPMANAVVHSSSVPSGGDATISEPSDEKSGFWGSVTSLFTKKSENAEVQSETGITKIQEKVEVKPAVAPKSSLGTAQSKKLVPIADAVVPVEASVQQKVSVESVKSQPVTDVAVVVEPIAVQESPVTEEVTEKSFWGSVTSYFKKSDKADESVQQERKKVVSGAESMRNETVSSVSTGKDTLAENAGVRKMIEQIEGPPPEPEVVAVKESIPVPQKQAPAKKEEVIAPIPAAVVADKTIEKVEKTVAQTTEATVKSVQPQMQTVEEKVAAIPQADELVYNVETPAQASLNQQKIIERLLDDERCVGCDLAGADLSGKNLSKVDLERANLQGANLEDVDFDEANLKGAQLSGANLKEADLRDADLYLADFSGADLTGARFEGALIDSADFTGAKGVNLAGAVKDE